MTTQFLELCPKVFSITAVQRAVYDNIGILKCEIEVKDTAIVVNITSSSAFNEQDFRDAVLDHELRIKLENSTGYIRKALVERAIYSSLADKEK